MTEILKSLEMRFKCVALALSKETNLEQLKGAVLELKPIPDVPDEDLPVATEFFKMVRLEKEEVEKLRNPAPPQKLKNPSFPSEPNLKLRLRLLIGTDYGDLRKFSKTTGIPYTTIQAYLSGANRPSTSALQKMARTTNVDLHWLVTGKSLEEALG